MSHPPASQETPVLLDFYQELSIDRHDPVSVIQERLERIRLSWGRRVMLAGDVGEKAKHALAIVDQARIVLDDEDSKGRYDWKLRNAQSVKERETAIDWVTRAWTYYFAVVVLGVAWKTL